MSRSSKRMKPTLKEAFNDVFEAAPQERAHLLDKLGADHPELRARVERLLGANDRAGDLLASPTAQVDGADDGSAAGPDMRASGEAGSSRASGARVGAYRLLECIGEGGFGAVYLAEQREPVQRRVALKVVKPGMDTRQVIARFEAERQALARMDHPNIARVLDAGATEADSPLGPGRPYFVMELVKGLPITRYCDDQRLSLQERLALFLDACRAVQHAHQKGVIHRDLKPSNVLVSRYDERPVVKIIDFGIAKATSGAGPLTDKTLFTEFHQLIGTPAYMSPEQAGLSDIDIDTRSDIYSLGVLLYELLTGTTPFEPERLRNAEFDELRRIIREEEPPRPSTRASEATRRRGDRATKGSGIHEGGSGKHPRRLAPDPRSPIPDPSSAVDIAGLRRIDARSLARSLHGEPDWIVMKCLEKDRARRYETANDLAQDVEHYLNHEPVLAGPPSRLYRFRKFARRNRATVTAAALVAAALLVGMAGTTYGLVRAEQRRAEANAAQEREREQRELAQKRRVEAEEAQRLAEKREKETQQVSDFQSAMLSDIDVEAMGRGIKERFREQVRAALERQYVGEFPNRRKRTPEEIDAALAEFDERANAAQAMDVARRVMDEFVLARAAQALEKKFADQPLVRAHLHGAIGLAYQKLGLYRAAESHFRICLEIRERELGADHELVAYSAHDLGGNLFEQGDYAAAEPLIRQAMVVYSELHGADCSHLADALANLARVMNYKGDIAEAERLCRESLALRRKLFGDHDTSVAQTMADLAEIVLKRGDTAAADSLYADALTIARAASDDLLVDRILSDMALMLLWSRDPAEAERLLRESLAIKQSLLGDEHPEVAATLHDLGYLFWERGDHLAAEPLFREALAIRRTTEGDEHPKVAMELVSLICVLLAQDKYAAAEPLLHEALAVRRNLPGGRFSPEGESSLSSGLAHLGSLLLRHDEHAKAEPILRELLAIRQETITPDLPAYWRVVSTRSMLGGALAGKGAALIGSDAPAAIAKFTEAEPLLVEAGEWLIQNPDRIPQQSRAARVREALERIVRLYESWDAVLPDNDKADQAAEWRAKLEELAPDKADGG